MILGTMFNKAQPPGAAGQTNPQTYPGPISQASNYIKGKNTNAALAGSGAHAPGGETTTDASAAPYGTESGPTYAEDRYNSRATGTDPGWEYATGRATDAINNAYAARGGYNSSGATNSLSDMFANATSQREGQLDSLASAADAARASKIGTMFNEGNSIASGKAGTAAGYDSASGSAQEQALRNQLTIQLQKAGVDPAKIQAEVNTILAGTKIATS